MLLDISQIVVYFSIIIMFAAVTPALRRFAKMQSQVNDANDSLTQQQFQCEAWKNFGLHMVMAFVVIAGVAVWQSALNWDQKGIVLTMVLTGLVTLIGNVNAYALWVAREVAPWPPTYVAAGCAWIAIAAKGVLAAYGSSTTENMLIVDAVFAGISACLLLPMMQAAVSGRKNCWASIIKILSQISMVTSHQTGQPSGLPASFAPDQALLEAAQLT